MGIWYNCTSQHIVQRCLGAKDEWNARMGVITAGFLHIILPAFFVLPGIIAFKLYPNLPRPDHAYILLVKTLVPPGLRGLILAAIAAALMSHLSAMINSTSTILTMDLYKRLWKPDASEKTLVAFGQWSGGVVMALGIAMAIYFSTTQRSLFVLIQEGFAYIAPPFAVIFTTGLLWRRANGVAALTTIVSGFCFTLLLQLYLFKQVGIPDSLRQLSAPRAARLGVLHDRDDRDVAADRAAGPGEDEGHHLERALRRPARRRAGAL